MKISSEIPEILHFYMNPEVLERVECLRMRSNVFINQVLSQFLGAFVPILC